LSELGYLNLSGTAVGDAGLANLTKVQQLESLDISDTRITGVGLAHVPLMSHLYRLDLSGTAVDDAGLARLFDDEGRPLGFEVLNIEKTRISPGGVQRFLSKLPQPDRINLHAKIGKKGVMTTIW